MSRAVLLFSIWVAVGYLLVVGVHALRRHRAERRIWCSDCGRYAANAGAHLRDVHGVDEGWCQVCARTVGSDVVDEHHRLFHTRREQPDA